MDQRDPLKIRVKRRLGPVLNYPLVNAMRGVPLPDVKQDGAQLAIARMVIEGGKLIARVGETEGRAASWRLRNRMGRKDPVHYEEQNCERLKLLAGYFPITDVSIDRLADLYLQSIAQIDLYAAWTPHDRYLCPKKAIKCRLIDIEPFFTSVRWTRALEGKRVTIVSPFRSSIMTQWKKREKLFEVETVPDCKLQVVQAPQTQCEVDTKGQDWYDNLQVLINNVHATEPEVVIIGAGAYGLPIGADAARRGATSIVMGGSTQLLFGLIGNRWLPDPNYASLQNEHWARPGTEERPKGFENFETSGGAYW